MLDQNTIIEIVNNTLPAILSSPVLIKLIGAVEGVVKTLYAPTLTLKNGKAEVDVELYRKQKMGELLENQTFTLYEITKLKNFVNAANFAAEELKMCEEENSDNSDIDFDWIMRFFDSVSGISNKEMQKLWGKVLAGEIRQPGICSLRTLEIIRNMSQKEAEVFHRLCEYVLVSGDCYFIFDNGFLGVNTCNNESHNYILEAGLNYSEHIIPMIECGLLSIDNDIATDFQDYKALSIGNKDTVCFITSNGTKESFISLEAYVLTTNGKELFKIIQSMPEYRLNNEYSILCFKELKEIHPELNISAFKIIGEN